MTLSRPYVLLVLAVATLLNISPLLFYHIGGDISFQFFAMRCFAEQFWQGDLYPRWCLNADAGLGTPLFVLYFPLPFYISSLLQPLMLPSSTSEGLYITSMALATLTFGLTCYNWLREVVTPSRALWVAALCLFLPYRSEVLFMRSGYSEAWCLAFMPLLFKYARRLVQHKGRNTVVQLAASVALCLLSHVPVAAVGLLGAGLYLLAMSHDLQSKLQFAGAVLWGAALSAFYMVPAAYYKSGMSTEGKIEQGSGARIWSNDFISVDNYIIYAQYALLISIAMSLVGMLLLASIAVRRRFKLADSWLRREVHVFGWLLFAGFILFLPISKPLYAVIGPLQQVLFPWRMQGLMMLASGYLLAVWAQHFLSAKALKTSKSDYALLVLVLALMAHFISSERVISKDPAGYVMADARYTGVTTEYRTRWTDEAHYSYGFIYEQQKARAGRPLMEAVGRDCAIQHSASTLRGFTLQTNCTAPGVVRLAHRYFPIWQAFTHDGKELAITPEPKTGFMLLHVPKGVEYTAVRYSMSAAAWWVGYGSAALSLMALLLLVYKHLLRRKRLF